MKNILFLFAFLCFGNLSFCQNTVGVISSKEGAMVGYTFFSPSAGTKSYMVDNCGHLVNEWDRGTEPGLSAYFLDNGLMLRTYQVNPIGPFTSYSNAGGLELVDWDNNTVWSYEFNTSEWLSHHDAVMMPNGNILVLTWELVYADELIDLGRDPDEIASQGFMWSEKVIEVKPIGSSDMEIVWYWEIKNHYIQDFDESAQNFGVVAEHPELFDINLPELQSSNSNSSRDWNHVNAIDYNPALDLILLSARNSDEIWVLDHSTSIEEAASHEGGNYGMGGDFLFRWGNANAYDRGDISDQKLFGQHGVNWIQDQYEDGRIMIYNNGNGRPGPDYSTAEIITPPSDADGNFIIDDLDPFGPELPEWIYNGADNGTFYSPYFSNAIELANKNVLVNAGSFGRIYEVNKDGDLLWHYVIPLSGDFPVPQGANANGNGTFRAYKYPVDYTGFDGITITQGELLEINNNPPPCEIINSTNDVDLPTFSTNYLTETMTLEIKNPFLEEIQLVIVNVQGKVIKKIQVNAEMHVEELGHLPKGMYFANLQAKQVQLTTKCSVMR